MEQTIAPTKPAPSMALMLNSEYIIKDTEANRMKRRSKGGSPSGKTVYEPLTGIIMSGARIYEFPGHGDVGVVDDLRALQGS
jgi:hypothetical protein